MQQKGFLFFVVCLCIAPRFGFAADLLADEQGPTAPEAVATVTANEDFLLPSYVAPTTQQTAPVPSEVDILNEIFGSAEPESVAPKALISQNEALPSRTFTPQTGIQPENDLLTPLPPKPVIQAEPAITPKKMYFQQANYADQALALGGSASSGIGMPREIRITFYQGQTALSAQALKWVKSFALHVVNDPRLLAEIRVSNQDPKIQEKRLKLLLQVLKEMGVSAHQIRLYQTPRESNSILIGYAENSEYTLPKNVQKSTERIQKTIDW